MIRYGSLERERRKQGGTSLVHMELLLEGFELTYLLIMQESDNTLHQAPALALTIELSASIACRVRNAV